MQDLAEFAIHGGALSVAERAFPNAPRPWLDLSTGLNPVAYPFAAPDPEAWTRLPDDAALARMETAAAARYGAPARTSIVAAPGTQAIIQRLPSLADGRDIRIFGPSYGEFARVFGDSGARIRIVATSAALAGADVAVVVNPNNPDGRSTSREALLGLAREVGLLVVDEAFADALPASHSLIPDLPTSRVIVLRSFGKIYGLAGVRLGFAVTSADIGEAVRRMLGPWAVSGPAIAIATQALSDARWLAETSARLRDDGERLELMLRQIGAVPVGSTPLFRLIADPRAPDLFAALARRGILTRPFAMDSSWLRLGFPGKEADWDRLRSALFAVG